MGADQVAVSPLQIARDRLQWAEGNDKCHFKVEQPTGED
jgi:hypothetical protein